MNADTRANIDAAEIAKFEALASRWWDPSGEFRPLHQMNPLRANYIDRRSAVAGKRVLDVGCGGGILSEGLAQRGATVTGIDMGEAPLAVERLQELYLEHFTHAHYARFIRPSELAGWARRAGLDTQDISGMLYNPLTQAFSLGSDVDVNYLVHARRPG